MTNKRIKKKSEETKRVKKKETTPIPDFPIWF